MTVKIRWSPTTISFGASLTKSVDKRQHYQAVGYGKLLEHSSRQNVLGRQCEPPVHFAYGGLVGPSFDSHQLLEYALETGGWQVQHQLVEVLQMTYFEKNEDINNSTVLASCAEEVGLNAEEVQAMLASGRYSGQVRSSITANRGRSQGAPTFFFDQVAAPGVLQKDDFQRVFSQLV